MPRSRFILFLGLLVAIATVLCLESDSPLRVERLLHMEEEMIDFSDFVINQEKKIHKTENVELLHSFDKYLKFLKKAKYANELSLNNTHAIQRDPIAIYHLKKRLTDKWLPHFEMLKETEVVAYSQRLQERMDNIVSVIIAESRPIIAIENILRLQEIFKIPSEAIVSGKIDPKNPSDPIQAADIAEIAEYVSERDGDKQSLEWLELAMTKADKKSKLYLELLRKKARLLLHLEEMQQAMEIYEKLMKLEPNKRSHKSSYEYAKMKLHKEKSEELLQQHNTSSIFWHNVCNGQYHPNSENVQNLQCYEREVENHFGEKIQVEELHHDPKVVIVRNMFHPDIVSDALNGYSKEAMAKLIGDKYEIGVRTRAAPAHLTRKYMRPLHETLCNVTFHNTQLKLIDSVYPITFSEEGPGGNADFHATLRQDHEMKTVWHTLPIAHYTLFLSDVEQGGGLAFPSLRLHVKPEKGAAVFWSFKTRFGPVHKALRKVVTCPPLIGTQWMARATITHNFIYNSVDI